MVCFSEKTSKPRSKARAHAARITGIKMQMASALDKCMLQCTQLSDFSSVVTCGLQPLLQFGDSSSARNPATTVLVRYW